jgi:hypothetical protein
VVTQGAQIPGRSPDPVGQSGSVEPDALPGVYLGLPVKRQVIGILGYQHLGDQCLGRNAALNDPRRRRRLHDRALARTAAITRPPGDHDAEGGRHHIEALGDILADLVEGAAAAGASIALDVNDLFDPLEMRGQRTAVGLAHRITARPSGLRFAGGLGFRERRLGILKAQLQLILIELLGTAAEPMTPKSLDDRPQAFGFRVGTLELAGLFEDERA